MSFCMNSVETYEMASVSVIVPVMNCGKYIDQCMESLMGQTYKNYEVLLMAGQSRDDSLQKCLEWQKRDNRVIIVSRKDSSLGDARNYALNMAKGKYILYVDADDFVEPDYIEEMVSPLEENDEIDITCCGYREYEDGKNEKTGFMPHTAGMINSDFQSYLDLLGGKATRVWTKAYRRGWLTENGITQFDGYCEDQAVKFMLAGKVQKIYCIRKALYHYRTDNAESRVYTLKGNTDYPKSVAFGLEYLKSHGIYGKIHEIAKRHIIGELLYILDKVDNNEEMVHSSKKFLKNYFPDVLDDYRRYRSERADIKEKRIILFGAGAELVKVIEKMGKENISYIVDNSVDLAGKKVEGIEIRPFSYLKANYKPEEIVLITSYKYCQNMAHQLWDSGIHGFWMARDMGGKAFVV